MINDLSELAITTPPAGSLLPRAFDIGIAAKLAIYDSIVIALAEQLECRLITVDQNQLAAAIANGIICKPIQDFPEFNLNGGGAR